MNYMYSPQTSTCISSHFASCPVLSLSLLLGKDEGKLHEPSEMLCCSHALVPYDGPVGAQSDRRGLRPREDPGVLLSREPWREGD